MGAQRRAPETIRNGDSRSEGTVKFPLQSLEPNARAYLVPTLVSYEDDEGTMVLLDIVVDQNGDSRI